MSPEYTQQTFFLLSQFFIRANIIWHILETHFMEEEKKQTNPKLTKTFLMANASGSLHDAYESAY